MATTTVDGAKVIVVFFNQFAIPIGRQLDP
jgi:hypothetical protein